MNFKKYFGFVGKHSLDYDVLFNKIKAMECVKDSPTEKQIAKELGETLIEFSKE